MNLHIETLGSGPDLALIHGWAMHAGVWDGVRTELGRHFRLHLVDLPGHGASPDAPFTLAGLAQNLAERLPAQVRLCGWSLGGQLALKMAALSPAQVERLILVGSTPRFTVGPDWTAGVEREVFLAFAHSLEQDYEGTLKRFLSLQARSGDDARALVKQLRVALFARGRPGVAALRSGLEILLETDLRVEAAVAQPTLLLHGDYDTLAPVGAARWLAAHLPRAELRVMAGAAHGPFLSHPGPFVEAVKEFLHD
jgi:pimeloyl-[acyl-carrier protein] methyl ester esterase